MNGRASLAHAIGHVGRHRRRSPGRLLARRPQPTGLLPAVRAGFEAGKGVPKGQPLVPQGALDIMHRHVVVSATEAEPSTRIEPTKGHAVVEFLKHMTVTESVADLLRREIQLRELQPGERLRQDAIAKKYGVSTTPVREAFAMLQSEGLVRIDPHKGALVFQPRIEDLTENYEIRGALEGLALDKAIDRFTPAELIELQELIDEMRRTVGKDWVELNNQFHRRMYEASGLPRLVQMIAELREWASAYVHLRIADGDVHRRRTNEEHQEILDACRAKDHDRARAAITKHVAAGIQHLSEIIDRQEQQFEREELDATHAAGQRGG